MQGRRRVRRSTGIALSLQTRLDSILMCGAVLDRAGLISERTRTRTGSLCSERCSGGRDRGLHGRGEKTGRGIRREGIGIHSVPDSTTSHHGRSDSRKPEIMILDKTE